MVTHFFCNMLRLLSPHFHAMSAAHRLVPYKASETYRLSYTFTHMHYQHRFSPLHIFIPGISFSDICLLTLLMCKENFSINNYTINVKSSISLYSSAGTPLLSIKPLTCLYFQGPFSSLLDFRFTTKMPA